MGRSATKAAGNVYYQARIEAAKWNDRLCSREGAAEALGVEAVPVVHGKWIKNEFLSTDFAPVHDCSVCGKSIEQKYLTLPPRCEYCGALMDGRRR